MSVPRPDMPANGSGRCLCGAVRFTWSERPRWAADCHCESCRRATSAAFASFIGVKNGGWAWTGAAAKTFESSPGVTRYFCGTCGSPMGYEADRFPGEFHFYAGSFDEPDVYRPDFEVHAGEKVRWATGGAGLTSHEGSSD